MMMDLSLICLLYTSIDSDDILSILSEKLKECDLYNDCEIWIDEFTTFTPQQIEVLKTLAKQCKNMNITLCNDGEIQFIEGETDIFDVIKNTENKLLKMMQENNVSYKEPVNLNKKDVYKRQLLGGDNYEIWIYWSRKGWLFLRKISKRK